MNKKPLEFIELTQTTVCEEHHKTSIGLGKDLLPETVISFAVNYGLQQIVQRDTQDFQTEVKASEVMMSDTQKYFQSPVNAILDPIRFNQERAAELMVFQRDFNRLEDKNSLIDELSLRLQPLVSDTLSGEVCLVADEFITNAVLNAPAPDQKRSELPAVDRMATIFCGTTDERLVIGCRDLYGSLHLAKLLKRVLQCYERGVADTINWSDDHGAGIGSFMVFDLCSSLYVGVEAGKQTIICCVFPRKLGGRKRRAMPKNLHLIELT